MPTDCNHSNLQKIAVVFSRFGPYHLARLKAAGKYFSQKNCRVIGIEIAESDDIYSWKIEKGADSFERVILFPHKNYHHLSRKLIMQAVIQSLNSLQPTTIALPGWRYPEAHAGFKWARANKRSLILMSESNHHDSTRIWLREQIKGRMVKNFDAALVGGSSHAQYVVSLGIHPTRVFLGYNVIDNDYFSENTHKIRQKEQDFRSKFGLPQKFFLASGRFVKKKNFDRLLRAYALYREMKSPDPWQLTLCGDGPLFDDLKALCEQLNIIESVYFPGFIQYPDLPVYYALAKAFILPSTTEQWGLVINEAMASGLPVLASNQCGAAKDLIENGKNGFTFDPKNIKEIAELLLRCSDGSLDLESMEQQSRIRIQQFSPEKFARGLWEAFAVGPKNEIS